MRTAPHLNPVPIPSIKLSVLGTIIIGKCSLTQHGFQVDKCHQFLPGTMPHFLSSFVLRYSSRCNQAWRNQVLFPRVITATRSLNLIRQGGAPVNARTCKHLKGLLGEEYENARLFLKNPDGPQPKVKSRGKGKAKATGQGEGDDDGDGKSVPQLLLANKWDLDNGIDPTGWWISEKLDGVRFILISVRRLPKD